MVVDCPLCLRSVIPSPEGLCPNCRKNVNEADQSALERTTLVISPKSNLPLVVPRVFRPNARSSEHRMLGHEPHVRR